MLTNYLNPKILLAFSLITTSFGGLSSQITPYLNIKGGVNIAITGEIMPDDDALFRKVVKFANDNSLQIDSISLNSLGGNVDSSLNIAFAIYSQKFSTLVTDTATCGSSCFILFCAGKKRFAYPQSKLGVHQMSINGISNSSSQRMSLKLKDVYDFYKIPENITDFMLKTPPSQVHWLSVSDKKHLNTSDGLNNKALQIYLIDKEPEDTAMNDYLRGLSFYTGIGVRKDLKKAFEQFTVAAKNNIPEAIHKLGVMYYKGYGITENKEKAYNLWEESASLGYFPSVNSIAVILESKDINKSVDMYKKTINSDEADNLSKRFAASRMGYLYSNGFGVKKSRELAYQYYKLGALSGDPESEYYYAIFLHIEKNTKEAIKWLTVSCNDGYEISCRYFQN